MLQLFIGFNIVTKCKLRVEGESWNSNLQLLTYNTLVLITSLVIVTITCGIQTTNVITMVMKMLNNSCNTCTLDLTNMFAQACGPGAHAYISVKSLMYMLHL